MNKITPFLWFDTNAKEAADFYVSVFGNSKITFSSPMMVSFTLDGQDFMALNGGPAYTFNEAISLYVSCKDQKEVDYYWGKLSEQGSEGQCGWLKDKYGISWQIVPTRLGELLGDPDPVKSKRVMDAMLKMGKIVLVDLEKAYAAE